MDHFERFVASGCAAGLAECATLPSDVVKVRLQVQQSSTAGIKSMYPKYSGFTDCLVKIVKQESALALWKGLVPALIRQVSYSSLSLVLYEPIRNIVSHGSHVVPQGSRDVTFLERLGAGGISGMISITCFNWTDVIKTQIQTSTHKRGFVEVASSIWKADGLPGFFAGIKPNMIRTFIVNATELGVYDHVKNEVFGPLFGRDEPISHLGASSIAGVASAMTSTPADVVKTRLMNSAGRALSNSPGGIPYRGFLDALCRIYMEEGVAALYKGFELDLETKTFSFFNGMI